MRPRLKIKSANGSVGKLEIRRFQILKTARPGIFGHILETAINNVGAAVRYCLDLQFNILRMHKIIAVQKTDIFALGSPDSVVARGADPRIGLAQNLNAFVFFRVEVQNRKRIVGRTVVNADNFNIFISLITNAGKRVFYKISTLYTE